MQQRSKELIRDYGSGSQAEQQRIVDALRNFGALERSELKSDFETHNQNTDNTGVGHGTL
jgi:hypothetical protein